MGKEDLNENEFLDFQEVITIEDEAFGRVYIGKFKPMSWEEVFIQIAQINPVWGTPLDQFDAALDDWTKFGELDPELLNAHLNKSSEGNNLQSGIYDFVKYSRNRYIEIAKEIKSNLILLDGLFRTKFVKKGHLPFTSEDLLAMNGMHASYSFNRFIKNLYEDGKIVFEDEAQINIFSEMHFMYLVNILYIDEHDRIHVRMTNFKFDSNDGGMNQRSVCLNFVKMQLKMLNDSYREDFNRYLHSDLISYAYSEMNKEETLGDYDLWHPSITNISYTIDPQEPSLTMALRGYGSSQEVYVDRDNNYRLRNPITNYLTPLVCWVKDTNGNKVLLNEHSIKKISQRHHEEFSYQHDLIAGMLILYNHFISLHPEIKISEIEFLDINGTLVEQIMPLGQLVALLISSKFINQITPYLQSFLDR